jgi:hypothetical protein
MKPLAMIRRTLIGLLGTAIGMAALLVTAHADEIHGAAASPVGGSIVIHDAETTQRDYCRMDADGRVWLELPGGHRFELVTSVEDPSIVNKGDGSFHPFDASEVRQAIAGVRFPVNELHLQIFILPLPRRGAMTSAAAPGMILLSPGVRGLAVQHQHAEVVHELGHVMQYALMPDADRERWGAYRSIRSIEDTQVYWSGAAHSNRPHEIFAEDFRALFGSALANYSGTIENAALTHPSQVAGLGDFMLGLAGGAPRPVALSAWPNPSRGAVTFTRSGALADALDLFDALGRRVATLTPGAGAAGTQWTWDGRDGAGRRVEPGVLFARPRGSQSPALRVTLLP